jgi:hypothetical protein
MARDDLVRRENGADPDNFRCFTMKEALSDERRLKDG